jgi:hypothetical protein
VGSFGLGREQLGDGRQLLLRRRPTSGNDESEGGEGCTHGHRIAGAWNLSRTVAAIRRGTPSNPERSLSRMEAHIMIQADTPMPGEDSGALIEDPSRLDEIEPPPQPAPTVPVEDDPEVKRTEVQPT